MAAKRKSAIENSRKPENNENINGEMKYRKRINS
jgi:hypothetical protein